MRIYPTPSCLRNIYLLYFLLQIYNKIIDSKESCKIRYGRSCLYFSNKMINNCSRSFLFFRKILKEGKLRENCRSFGFFNGNNELKYSSDKGDIYLTPKGMHSHTLIWMHGLGIP